MDAGNTGIHAADNVCQPADRHMLGHPRLRGPFTAALSARLSANLALCGAGLTATLPHPSHCRM